MFDGNEVVFKFFAIAFSPIEQGVGTTAPVHRATVRNFGLALNEFFDAIAQLLHTDSQLTEDAASKSFLLQQRLEQVLCLNLLLLGLLDDLRCLCDRFPRFFGKLIGIGWLHTARSPSNQ